MTAGELTISREHLAENRRMIIGRSIAASLAGAIPVPVMEDWLSFAICRGALRRIADSHSVDLDEAAIKSLFHGKTEAPEWGSIAVGTLAYKVISRMWRRVMIAYLAAKRAQAAARYFTLQTLFDHYCARLHVGMGLDGESALEVRMLMDRAIEETPGGIGRRLFRRGFVAAARATAKAPLRLADIASRGALGRLLTKRSEVEAAEEVDTALEAKLAEEKTFIARATKAVELQLSTQLNPYLDTLVDKFDELWREHNASDPDPR
jgi:hypothetical protein